MPFLKGAKVAAQFQIWYTISNLHSACNCLNLVKNINGRLSLASQNFVNWLADNNMTIVIQVNLRGGVSHVQQFDVFTNKLN